MINWDAESQLQKTISQLWSLLEEIGFSQQAWSTSEGGDGFNCNPNVAVFYSSQRNLAVALTTQAKEVIYEGGISVETILRQGLFLCNMKEEGGKFVEGPPNAFFEAPLDGQPLTA